MPIAGFFQRYFIAPIYDDSLGYNYVNSIVYGLIAAVLLFLIYKFLERSKIKINITFFWSLLPFVVFGAFTRVLVDKSILPTTFWTVAPGIYILTAGLFLATLFASYFIELKTKINYWKVSFAIGLFVLLYVVLSHWQKIRFENMNYGVAIVVLALAFFAVVAFILKKSWKFFNSVCALPIFAHMLDASATFVALDFLNYAEKHPLPVFVIGLANTAAIMYVLKLLVLIPAIYYIKKEVKSENAQNFFLIAIAVLGLAEGLRDLIQIIIA